MIHNISKAHNTYLMTVKKLIVILMVFSYLTGTSTWAADTIQKGDILSIQRCIQIAMKHHPAINAATGVIRQSESKIGQARAGFYPQINFQTGYTRVGPAAMSIRSDPFNHYTNSLNLKQTLFDFGKTATQVEIQTLGKQSSEADFQDTTSVIILNVKEAYYSFLKAKMSEVVSLETVNQFQQHLDVAKAFFETGKSSKIDVTSAEVNLSNARIQFISAQNALRIARVNLNKAMGVIAAPEYDVQEEFQLAQMDISFDDALAQAYANRPDILSANLKKDALKKNIELNKKSYLPVLSGNADYGYTGGDASMYQSWSVGVALTFPLFTGLSTQYAIEEAKASLDIATANEESLKQAIYLEVQSAWLNRKEAFERIEAGRMVIRQAEEALELARGRYATGVGSSIEITDSMIKLNNAKMNYISALSDFKVAEAYLEKSIGAKP